MCSGELPLSVDTPRCAAIKFLAPPFVQGISSVPKTGFCQRPVRASGSRRAAQMIAVSNGLCDGMIIPLGNGKGNVDKEMRNAVGQDQQQVAMSYPVLIGVPMGKSVVHLPFS